MIGLRSFRRTTISPTLAENLGEHYSEHELRAIDRIGTVVTIEAGAGFVTEGAYGREAMILLDGSAVVSRDGQTVATVGRGDVVGESAVLSGQPRNASLMATTEVTAVVFTGQEFRSLLHNCPRLAAQVNQLIEERQAA